MLVVAIVVAVVLRLWGLGSQSLWYDEWLTARAAGGSLGDLYRYVTEQAGIPPTFFGLEWLWAQVFGTSEASLRALPVLAGIATVPVAAWAASAWGAYVDPGCAWSRCWPPPTRCSSGTPRRPGPTPSSPSSPRPP